MKKPFRGRRGQKPARFFLTALVIAIAIFVLVTLIQHWHAKPASSNGRQAAASLSAALPESGDSLAGFKLFLRRGGCTTGCPYYALMLRRGVLEYIGVRDVKTRGKVREPLTHEHLQRVLGLVERASFFSLADTYEPGDPGCGTAHVNAPMLTVGVTLNGVTKIVKANMDCVNVPPRLVELAKGVDAVAGSARWTGAVRTPAPGS